MPNDYSYNVYGLHVVSQISCPELCPVGHALGNPDVTIGFGRVPDKLERPLKSGICYDAKDGEFLFHLENIGKYWVTDGRRICIEPACGADESEIRLFLLGSVFGALLLQRKMLPLHATCVRKGNWGFLLCGVSGIGKSTTAYGLMDRGFDLYADDICIVDFDVLGLPKVMPGLTHIKLWRDVLMDHRLPTDGLVRVRPELEKYYIPIERNGSNEPVVIKKIFILKRVVGQKVELQPIDGIMKVVAIRNQTFRRQYVEGLGVQVPHFMGITRLANSVSVSFVNRPSGGNSLDEVVSRMAEDFES